MNQKKIKSILYNFRNTLKETLPKKEKDINWVIACLDDICDWMVFSNDSNPDDIKRLGVELTNVIKLCSDSTKLAKKKDYDSLMQAIAYIKVRLFDVESNAKDARRKFDIINKNIEKKWREENPDSYYSEEL